MYKIRSVLIACIIVAAAAAAFGQTSVKAGSAAPAFTGTFIDGAPFSLADYRGRVVVIAFWSTRCSICHVERPKLNRLAAQYDPANVAFVAVSMENEEKINGYLKNNPFSFKVVPNGFGVVLQYADRSRSGFIDMGFPAFFVVDQNGIVQYRSSGYDKTETLNAAIGQLVKN